MIKYHLNPPKKCDICDNDIGEEFVDGKTWQGPWANMCLTCFGNHGVGIGLGIGQWYRKDENGYKKIGG